MPTVQPAVAPGLLGTTIDAADLGAGLTSTISGKVAAASISLSFAAAASDTVEERISFPFDLAHVEAISLGSIGVRGTGTVKVEKGMVAGGNTLLTGATFDVSTLGADNTMENLTLTGTTADLQGGGLDVITISFVNCTVPHLLHVRVKVQ